MAGINIFGKFESKTADGILADAKAITPYKEDSANNNLKEDLDELYGKRPKIW